MAKKDLTVLTDVAMITCVVQKGLADTIVKAAREAGAVGATVFYARGSGVRERLGVLGVAVEVEKEVINIVCSSDQVDHLFEKMYLAGNLNTPGMGIIYITPLEKAATYIPHEIIDRLEPRKAQPRPNARRVGARA